MKTLRILYSHFHDEVHGVEEYVGDAFTVKSSQPELSKAYLEMAKAEYDHACKCKEHMCRIVDEMCKCGKLSEDVLEIWDDLKGKMVRDLAKAKVYLDMPK